MTRLPARILATWRQWTPRTRALVVGCALLVAVGAGLGAYALLKRPGDVTNPDVAFVTKPEPKPKPKRKPVEVVNWPTYGFDNQRTRYLRTKEVRPPYSGSKWSFQAGKLLEFSPIVVRGTLYFMDKNALFYALDAETGKVRWKRGIGALNASSPAYRDGMLYAVSLQPGQAVALRARDGKVVWRHALPGRSETSPLVVGNKVIVGSESGHVFALNHKTGAVIWEAETAGNVKGALAFENGLVYGANYAGEVFALRASDGSTAWKSSTLGLSLGRAGPVYSTPAVAFGRVYLGSIDGRVYSFDAKTGEIAWSHSTGDWVYAAPAVADTPRSKPTVYIGSKDQNFYALDAQTGAVRWQQDVGGIVLGAASVIGEVVYVGVIGPNIGSFGFNVKTGRKVFEHELGEYNPVISDGRRLYLTGASGIRAFEHETRAERRAKAKRRRAERRERRRRIAARRAAQREQAAQRRQRRQERAAALRERRQERVAKLRERRRERAAKSRERRRG